MWGGEDKIKRHWFNTCISQVQSCNTLTSLFSYFSKLLEIKCQTAFAMSGQSLARQNLGLWKQLPSGRCKKLKTQQTLSNFCYVLAKKTPPSLLTALVNDEKCHHLQLHLLSPEPNG